MPHTVTTERITGQWEPPYQGVMRQVRADRVPSFALYSANNFLYRNGFGIVRPGLKGLTSGGVISRPMGLLSLASLAKGAFDPAAFDPAAFDTNPDSRYLVAATVQSLFAYWGAEWHDLAAGFDEVFDPLSFDPLSFATTTAGNRTAGSADHPARFATMEVDDDILGSGIRVLVCNGIDTPVLWDTRGDAATTLAGWPALSDAIQLESRFVGLVPPFKVIWGEALSIAPPSALAFRNLAETTDEVVAIVNLGGTTNFIIYKQESIWAGRAQGGPTSSFFAFDYKGKFQGPASPSAVVNFNGVAIHMTPSGRIGVYDGAQIVWACDGAWVQVRDGAPGFPKLDLQYANRIFGVINPFFKEIWFYYPMEGDSGDLYGICILTLPDVDAGVKTFGGFPGRLRVPVSCGTHREGLLQDAVVMRSDDFQAYTQNGPDDASLPITGWWQPGLVASQVPGQFGATGQKEVFRMDGHESMFERSPGYGTVTVTPLYSYILDTPGGTSGTPTAIDLTKVQVKEEKSGDIRGRFFGLRYDFSTPSVPRWQGSMLSARRIEYAPDLTKR